jgi:uncharacterized damage-inducible protein DinB
VDQNDLLHALERLNGSLEELFAQIPETDRTWRPRDNMRNLLELANHLAQIPAVDLLILQGGSQEQVRDLEARLWRDQPSALFAVWREGVEAVGAFFKSLTPERFQTEIGRAFYGHEAPLKEWLMEIITHAYHHRAQLFTYLKILGRPVDMYTLYL